MKFIGNIDYRSFFATRGKIYAHYLDQVRHRSTPVYVHLVVYLIPADSVGQNGPTTH